MIASLIVALVVIVVIWVIAHLIVRVLFAAGGPLPADFAWVVYVIALLITILVLWRVIAPYVGPLP